MLPPKRAPPKWEKKGRVRQVPLFLPQHSSPKKCAPPPFFWGGGVLRIFLRVRTPAAGGGVEGRGPPLPPPPSPYTAGGWSNNLVSLSSLTKAALYTVLEMGIWSLRGRMRKGKSSISSRVVPTTVHMPHRAINSHPMPSYTFPQTRKNNLKFIRCIYFGGKYARYKLFFIFSELQQLF